MTGVISKIFASSFGVVMSLLSLIPLPRLNNWCPPVVPIFDFLIALAVGIILYVLVLWAVVSWFDRVKYLDGGSTACSFFLAM